jgi:hypothetical protein
MGFVGLIGMVLFAPLGWLAMGGIGRLYEAKRLSNQTLVFDSIWLLQSLWIWMQLVFVAGHQAWIGLSAFALYKVATPPGCRRVEAAACKVAAAEDFWISAKDRAILRSLGCALVLRGSDPAYRCP